VHRPRDLGQKGRRVVDRPGFGSRVIGRVAGPVQGRCCASRRVVIVHQPPPRWSPKVLHPRLPGKGSVGCFSPGRAVGDGVDGRRTTSRPRPALCPGPQPTTPHASERLTTHRYRGGTRPGPSRRGPDRTRCLG
jgi:hypothetical protein